MLTGRILDTLTPSDIHGYIAQRQANGVKPATIDELRLLSAALNYAKREWE